MFIAAEAVRLAVEERFGRGRVLVVGDMILDVYLWGEVNRISPEAPVPVVRLERRTETAAARATFCSTWRRSDCGWPPPVSSAMTRPGTGSFDGLRRPGSQPTPWSAGTGARRSSRRASLAVINR